MRQTELTGKINAPNHFFSYAKVRDGIIAVPYFFIQNYVEYKKYKSVKFVLFIEKIVHLV